MTTHAWAFALFGKSWATATWIPSLQKESQMQAMGDACYSLLGQQGGCYELVPWFSA
jgi:hypothetical protein